MTNIKRLLKAIGVVSATVAVVLFLRYLAYAAPMVFAVSVLAILVGSAYVALDD